MKPRTRIAVFLVTAPAIGLATLGGAGLLPTTGQQPEPQAAEHPNQVPEIIAVKFHADWCGYCKAMGPIFEELQAKYDQEPVLYIEFDQTREFGRKQSAYMANALGLDSMWAENGGKTGFVLLIDATTKEVLQRLSHERNLKQMGTALQDAVAAASEPGSQGARTGG